VSAQERATQIPFRDEAHFQSQLVKFAQSRGWLVFHVSDSRKEVTRRRGGTNVRVLVGDPLTKGYPDLTLVHPMRRLFVVRELKTDHGRLTVEQRKWIVALEQAHVDVDVWRPRDLKSIERFLAGPQPKAR
jgi:hypothetical protein